MIRWANQNNMLYVLSFKKREPVPPSIYVDVQYISIQNEGVNIGFIEKKINAQFPYHLNDPELFKLGNTTIWSHIILVTTTAQLYLTKPELKFCECSSPAYSVSEIRDGSGQK